MRFRLWTTLWAFAVLASAMATFGGVGVFVGSMVIGLWMGAFAQVRIKSIEWLVVFSIIGVLVALLLPAMQVAREDVRRVQCMNNMRNIALALLNYEKSFGSLPAASQPAPDGEQLQSWRLWICPFLEEDDFFDKYDTDESWDGPNNTKLAANAGIFSYFECPEQYSEGRLSHYLAVVGEHTAWPTGRSRSLSEFKDGDSNTILFIEAPHKRVPWTKPEDLNFEEAIKLLSGSGGDQSHCHEVDEGFFYKPSHGIFAAFADGSLQFLILPISKEHATALLTVDGGEELDHREVTRLTSPELDDERIYSLSVFLLLSLLPLFKLVTRKHKEAAI